MVKKQVPRRRVAGARKPVTGKPLPKRRRVVRRPPVRTASAPAPRTKHGPSIVKQAIRHIGELYAKRDSSHFVYVVFYECGLVYPQTNAAYFPSLNYFKQVRTPLPGDVVLYAEHMGIYAQANKMIIADPAEQLVKVAFTNGFLNPVGYFRWYQD